MEGYHGGKLSKGLPFLAGAKAKHAAEKAEHWNGRAENNASSRLPAGQKWKNGKHYDRAEKRKAVKAKYQDKYDSPGALTSEDSTDDIFPTRWMEAGPNLCSPSAASLVLRPHR